MSEAAVMLEAEDRPMELSDDVEIRRFGCQGHGSGRQRSFAIESGAPQTGARQEVGDRFQVV
jgi:hypothetical protein